MPQLRSGLRNAAFPVCAPAGKRAGTGFFAAFPGRAFGSFSFPVGGRKAFAPKRQDGGFPMIQQTLSIIKPDAVARNLQGEILAMIQKSGLRIVAMKMIRLTRAQAEAFYEVHKERPFYADLVEYMTSGPVVCSVLEGENAIAAYRALMGATNPANAAEGTIRRLYAESVQANAVHGSDAPETAAREVAFFFSRTEIVG